MNRNRDIQAFDRFLQLHGVKEIFYQKFNLPRSIEWRNDLDDPRVNDLDDPRVIEDYFQLVEPQAYLELAFDWMRNRISKLEWYELSSQWERAFYDNDKRYYTINLNKNISII
jgi:hypothetical protein